MNAFSGHLIKCQDCHLIFMEKGEYVFNLHATTVYSVVMHIASLQAAVKFTTLPVMLPLGYF